MSEKEEILQMYRDALGGRLARFPDHLFVGEQGKKYIAYMTRYLIEDYLHIKVNEIPKKVTAPILWKHRLRPAAALHNWTYLDIIENAYPNQFKVWEFYQAPNKYWYGQKGWKRAAEIIRYAIEQEEKIPIHEIPAKVNIHFFKRYRLLAVLGIFGDSPYEAVNAVYPGRFKPWEFANVPVNCWKDPYNVKEAMDHLIFGQLGLSSYQAALKDISKKHFFQYRMTGLLQMAFDNRMFQVKKWIQEQIAKSDSLY